MLFILWTVCSVAVQNLPAGPTIQVKSYILKLCPSRSRHISFVSWIALHISPALKCQSSHRVIQCKRGYTHGDCHHQVQLCTTQHFSQVDHDAAWAAPSLLEPLSTFFLDPLFWGFSSSWFFTTGLNCCKRKNEWNHKVSGQVYWRVKINHTRVC